METWALSISSGTRYSILKEIGSGASAMVFLARDSLLQRRVAVKRLHPHLLNSAEAVARFKKEALAVAALSHENVVRLLDAGEMDGRLFLAMEYVDGFSLDEVVRRSPGPLPNLVCLEILRQLLGGLAAAHRSSIIHRDVKPSNVLVDLEGGVRLTDFGLANLVGGEGSLTLTGALIGTPQYMSPEQALGREASAKSDVFGAGLIFYRCLTGKQAFAAKTPQESLLAASRARFAAPFILNPKTLPCLAPLVQKMLAKDPEARPQASECLELLDTIAREEGLILGKERVAEFLRNPEGSRRNENDALRELFLERAERLRGQGKTTASLRSFANAEIFGLDAKSAERFNSLKTRSHRIRWAAALSAALVLALPSFWDWDRRPPAKDETLAAETPVPPSLEALDNPILEPPSSPPALAEPMAVPPSIGIVKASVMVETPKRKAGAAAGPALLLVKTNPSFAEVLVDGKHVGVTPMRAALALPGGWHRVSVRREFWLPLDTALLLESGDQREIRLKMIPEMLANPEP